MDDKQRERRERIATAVLAGMMANHTNEGWSRDGMAKYAIEQADSLIAALDAPRKTGADSAQNGGDNGEA